MAAVIINIAMVILTACLSPTSFSFFGLVNGITLIVVPTYIATTGHPAAQRQFSKDDTQRDGVSAGTPSISCVIWFKS